MTTKRIPSYFFYFALPISIILLNHIVGTFLYDIYREWTWLPVTFIYWSCLWFGILFLKRGIGIDYQSWLRSNDGHALWKTLSIIVAFLMLPTIGSHLDPLKNESLISLFIWIAYAFINPFFEESYWRGFMIAYPVQWSAGIKIFFSTLLFTWSRIFIWGVFFQDMTSPLFLVPTFVSAAIWGITFQKDKSILWPYLGHSLMVLLGLFTYLYLE